MSGPSVSIVVVSWNTSALLQACLDSIPRSWPGHAIEVVVVDNGSNDGTQRMIMNQYPEVQLIETHANLGYSKAINRGLSLCTAEFICLLNSDTVMTSLALQNMVQYLRANRHIGMVGPVLVNMDGSPQPSRHNFPFIWPSVVELIRRHRNLTLVDTPEEVDWLVGACLVLPRAILEHIGGLDEEYPFYGEDMDLAYQVRQCGRTVVWLPAARVYHIGEASSPPKPSPSMRVRSSYEAPLRFLSKHGSRTDVVFWRCSRGITAAMRYAKARWIRRGADTEHQLATWSGVVRLCTSGRPTAWTLDSSTRP